jgi:hypothetical protein
MGEPARRMAIPYRHSGMEVAYALSAERELHTPTPSAEGHTLVSLVGPPGRAHGARGRDLWLGARSEAPFAPLITSISNEEAGSFDWQPPTSSP